MLGSASPASIPDLTGTGPERGLRGLHAPAARFVGGFGVPLAPLDVVRYRLGTLQTEKIRNS